jgi:hypothetical protein
VTSSPPCLLAVNKISLVNFFLLVTSFLDSFETDCKSRIYTDNLSIFKLSEAKYLAKYLEYLHIIKHIFNRCSLLVLVIFTRFLMWRCSCSCYSINLIIILVILSLVTVIKFSEIRTSLKITPIERSCPASISIPISYYYYYYYYYYYFFFINLKNISLLLYNVCCE